MYLQFLTKTRFLCKLIIENLNYIGNVLCVLHSKNWAFGQIYCMSSFIPLFLNCHTRIHYFYRTIKRERSRKATSLLIRCMYQETKPCFVSMRTVLHLSTYLTPTECGRWSVTSNCWETGSQFDSHSLCQDVCTCIPVCGTHFDQYSPYPVLLRTECVPRNSNDIRTYFRGKDGFPSTYICIWMMQYTSKQVYRKFNSFLYTEENLKFQIEYF